MGAGGMAKEGGEGGLQLLPLVLGGSGQTLLPMRCLVGATRVALEQVQIWAPRTGGTSDLSRGL